MLSGIKDFQMQNYSNCKLIECFDNIDFQIIFTEASKQYIIDTSHSNKTGNLFSLKHIDDVNPNNKQSCLK
jgi:hypothetical protein